MKSVISASLVLALAIPATAAFSQQADEMKCKDMKGMDMKGMNCAETMKGGDMKGGDMKGMGVDKKPAGASQVVHVAKGTVTKVDAGAGTVTVDHEPVKTMKWPAMSMGFKVKDKTLMNKLEVGKKVEIKFQQEGEDFVVTSVK